MGNRGENLAIAVLLLIALPIILFVLAAFGYLLYYTAPIIILVVVMIYVIYLKRKSKPVVYREGSIDLIELPQPAKDVMVVVVKVVLGILVTFFMLCIMAFLPIGISLIIAACVIGYLICHKR